MLSEAAFSDVYLDFQEFSRLRSAAREQSPQALEGVARQFQAVFLKMMLKSMRDASFGDPLFDSQATGFYRDLFDQQMTLELSKTQGLGLAELMVRQLRGPTPEVAADEASALRMPERRLPFARFATSPSPSASSEVETCPQTPAFETRQDFIDTLRPYAREAAERLGVAPGLLLAQAALETGWGRSVFRRADGGSSHNLFGIKADGRWSGDRVTVSTLEYADGLPVRQRTQFRAYPSFAASFDDYANLLQGSSRYADALTKTAEPEGFMQALQAAGYATDPAYARKVIRIWRKEMADAVKIAQGGPI
jgi:flagellar protein FlgJ